jgi:hypothetical protein
VQCHAPSVALGIRAPANHASFTNDACQSCHKPPPEAAPTSAPTKAPPAATTAPPAGATPQPTAGAAKAIPANHAAAAEAFKDCVACHGVGKIKPGPATHASFTNDTCQTCHKPAEK